MRITSSSNIPPEQSGKSSRYLTQASTGEPGSHGVYDEHCLTEDSGKGRKADRVEVDSYDTL